MLSIAFLLSLSTCISGGGGPQPTPGGSGGELLFYHNGHRGEPLYMTDESATVVWMARYRPYGDVEVDEDVDGDGTAIVNNLRYPGQYDDRLRENVLLDRMYYNMMRYYDPSMGRYLALEHATWSTGVGKNRYGYVDNNPISYIDPFGLIRLHEDFLRDFPKSSARILSLIDRITLEKLWAWKQYGGAGTEQVHDALDPCKGPYLTSAFLVSRISGRFTPPGFIEVDIRDLQDYEKGYKGAAGRLDRIVEHELTHYFEHRYGRPAPLQPDRLLVEEGQLLNEFNVEEGFLYEEYVYGSRSLPKTRSFWDLLGW